MTSAQTGQGITMLAPAKVNLWLHITGKRPDGYHLLDSLVAFADFGDRISLSPADDFSFMIEGAFAESFSEAERRSGADSANLAVRAACALAELVQRDLRVTLRLTKNLPLASGLGGGSSDAAATIRALLDWWKIPAHKVSGLNPLLCRLGADMPVCMAGKPARIRHTGDRITPVSLPAPLPILLVNPQKPCPTASVFRAFRGAYRAPAPPLPPRGDLIAFLKSCCNDLTLPATQHVPEIETVLAALTMQKDCQIARLSGSGASCFGLFASQAATQTAAKQIQQHHPDWWIKSGFLQS